MMKAIQTEPAGRGAAGPHLRMTLLTSCPSCRTELTVPEEAGAKRLRCPKCGTRFYAQAGLPQAPSSQEFKTNSGPGPGPGPASSHLPSTPAAGPNSRPGQGPASSNLPSTAAKGPNPRPGPASSNLPAADRRDADMPYVSGTVFREAFDDVPLVDDSQERRPPSAEFHQIPPKPGASRPPSGAGSSRVGSSGPGASRPPTSPPSIVEADAAALFADDDEPKPRPTQAAEARYKPRPCPECDTVVAAGMSLCPRCGLDLDTGVRIEVEGEGTYDEEDEELLGGMPAGAPTRSAPFVLMMVGTLTLMGSIVLLAASLFTLDGIGRIALAIVCAFGVYASIEFLRGKSAKPLLLAIALAAAVDVVGLIVLPLVEADSNVTIGTRINEEGEEVPVLARLEDRLDRTKVGWGIALLLAAGASGFLLTTTPVRRMFEQQE